MELKAQPRTELGKKVKALRRAGFLPAVVYGEKVKSQPIAVPYKDFEKVYREAGESTLIKLDVDGKSHNVLIHDIKNDPLKGIPLHADFYAVRMDKEIRTKVSIEFFGESPAVKNEGGILVRVMQELEVEALPQDLPRELRIDLSGLAAFGSKLFVKDIPTPKGVKILAEPDEVVVLIEAPRSEEELAALEQVSTAAAPEEVKTEREIKEETKVVEETAGEEKEE
ncbi:MAG: 50S ribosomal protein L25/general stress protein Ctc [Candidatus Sungiibacteriota bacterium]|uniref:Large ribosomal subunit protein bL25 n=1 Tax=Candidatus Sungiibacteriota bacterium TaxID=2750080 RepID=A0A7T5RKH5_9BACT|nr:MAG: 50S ribosomal protein L25/general stress protein Ctc [Candidatus Sungbacteria bacterium]